MFSANYKFQINQPVIMVDKTKKKFYKVTILQVHMDIYKKGSDVITEIRYVAKVTEGEYCATNMNACQSQLYATLEEAINDNKF